MTTIRPLHSFIIVEPIKPEERSAGGLYLPPAAQEKQVQGYVRAVGRGVTQPDGSVRALDVVKGDRVIYGKYSGTEVTVDGTALLMLREEDVFGVVEVAA